MNAIVEIQTQRPVSLELYKDYKELGRFMLRYGGSTIAAGVVTEVMTRCGNTTSDARSLVPCGFLVTADQRMKVGLKGGDGGERHMIIFHPARPHPDNTNLSGISHAASTITHPTNPTRQVTLKMKYFTCLWRGKDHWRLLLLDQINWFCWFWIEAEKIKCLLLGFYFKNEL